MYSRAAWGHLMSAFPLVLKSPADLMARSDMLLGSALAGLAIENSMLGAAHSMANPLTAHFGIAHGIAVGLVLPHVVRFNAKLPEARREYALLASQMEGPGPGENEEGGVQRLLQAVHRAMHLGGVPPDLKTAGVEEWLLPELAVEAAQQWTAKFNPRSLSVDDFRDLYRAAFQPFSMQA